jgi:hypothetical protein
MNQDEDFFTTHDLSISAVLVALGHPLDRIERKTNGKASFFFKSSPSIRKAVQGYWKQEIKINPQKLFDSLKFLKNRLYSNF